MDVDNANMYAIGSILSSVSNGPQNLATNLVQLSNFIELSLASLSKTHVLPLGNLWLPCVYQHNSFVSCVVFKFYLIFTICSFISLRILDPNTTMSVELS
jgi:hypothetical protein